MQLFITDSSTHTHTHTSAYRSRAWVSYCSGCTVEGLFEIWVSYSLAQESSTLLQQYSFVLSNATSISEIQLIQDSAREEGKSLRKAFFPHESVRISRLINTEWWELCLAQTQLWSPHLSGWSECSSHTDLIPSVSQYSSSVRYLILSHAADLEGRMWFLIKYLFPPGCLQLLLPQDFLIPSLHCSLHCRMAAIFYFFISHSDLLFVLS